MLHSNGKYLAFSTDSGTVGVIELSTKKITRMKTRHSSVRACSTLFTLLRYLYLSNDFIDSLGVWDGQVHTRSSE